MLQSKVSHFKKYLIVEALPSFYQISSLSYNDSGKQVEITQSRRFSKLAELKNFLGDFKYKDCEFIIVGLDSSLAATTYQFQKLERQNPKQAIDESEIESLISQLVWRFTSPTTSSLEQFQIRNFTIDGHKIINPIGLSGKNAVIYFSKTLVENNFLADIKKLLPLDKITLIGEAGSFWSHVISQTRQSTKPFLLVPIYYASAPVFIFKDEKIKYLRTINWGEKNLTSTLFGGLAIAEATARDILRVFCQQQTSKKFHKKISALWQKEFKSFSASVEKIYNKEKTGEIYFLPFFNFPIDQLKFKRRVHSLVVDNNFISQKLGFELKLNKGSENRFSTVALLAELGFVSMDNLLNKMANRRLRWRQ